MTIFLLLRPSQIPCQDKSAIATSALEYGGTVGKLLWVSVADHTAEDEDGGDRYRKLALQIKTKIDVSRASSSVIKANFDLMGTTLAYSAIVDPEPLSKGTAAIAAWSVKKTGDALGTMVLDQASKVTQEILAQGLKNTGLSQDELKTMSVDEFRAKVSDLQIGGKSMREILKDDPKSLELLQESAVDTAETIGIAALATAKGTADDVLVVRQHLDDLRQHVADYRDVVTNRLDVITKRMEEFDQDANDSRQKLAHLQDSLDANSNAVRTLTQINYSGWSPTQKLQALEGGLFPDLRDNQREALKASLEAEQKRDAALRGVEGAVNDLSNLAAIAHNIGLSPDVVTGLQTAQVAAGGIVKFATGDYLGAVASLTSLVGLGAPDAAAERHMAMMKYLQDEFRVVNQKLDRIIDLQIETLKALKVMSDQQQSFRVETLDQLGRIENTVLSNHQMLQQLLLSQWNDCDGLVTGTALNGQTKIPTRDVLVEVIGNPNTHIYAGKCYSTMIRFLDVQVKPARWSSTIIDGNKFPGTSIGADTDVQKDWDAYQMHQNDAYVKARDFVRAALPDAGNIPAATLVRFAQPTVSTKYEEELSALLANRTTKETLDSFKCDQKDVLSPALGELICFGRVSGDSEPPLPRRWHDLLEPAPLGPLSLQLLESGTMLSTLSDFAQRKDDDSFVFVKKSAVSEFQQDGMTKELSSALSEGKGIQLLEKLRWLSELLVIQQSITYGGYTAELIKNALYDHDAKKLSIDVTNPTPLKLAALAAMRMNPLLARNVVMLAMRQAIVDSMGLDSALRLNFNQTYYSLALQNFAGPQACDGALLPREKLADVFPGWAFVYRAKPSEKTSDKQFEKCPPIVSAAPPGSHVGPDEGVGIATTVGDLDVLVPSPIVLTSGVFEIPDSLRLALRSRDRLNQAIIDRQLNMTVRSISQDAKDQKTTADHISFSILNEAWDWNTRKKTSAQ